MIRVGIDPGLDGAIAGISDGGSVEIADTPTLTIASKRGTKREYDLASMAAILGTWERTAGISAACIELVHAMPGQGVRSMFSMGYGVGAWEGLLAMLKIPYQRVTPQRWKKALMDGQGHDKDASRAVAMRLFPSVAHLLARKKDDGRAEALLISEYLRRTMGAGPPVGAP